MKSSVIFRMTVIVVSACLLGWAAPVAGNPIFDSDDFEDYTLGDQWHTGGTPGVAPVGWSRNAHIATLDIRQDPNDAGNQVLYMNAPYKATRKYTVAWTGFDPRDGAFHASLDFRPETTASFAFWLGGDGFSARMQVAGGNLTAFLASASQGDFGTYDTGQWYRATWEFDIPNNDPNTSSFRIVVHEIPSGEGALGAHVGTSATVPFTSTGDGLATMTYYNTDTDALREVYFDNYVIMIPEPGTLVLLAAGGLLLGVRRRMLRA